MTPYSDKDIEDLFNEILDAGDEVIGIFIASDFSGTYNSAVIAKEIIGSDKIHLIDSKTATSGLGALVLKAAKMKEEGKFKEEKEKTENR